MNDQTAEWGDVIAVLGDEQEILRACQGLPFDARKIVVLRDSRKKP